MNLVWRFSGKPDLHPLARGRGLAVGQAIVHVETCLPRSAYGNDLPPAIIKGTVGHEFVDIDMAMLLSRSTSGRLVLQECDLAVNFGLLVVQLGHLGPQRIRLDFVLVAATMRPLDDVFLCLFNDSYPLQNICDVVHPPFLNSKGLHNIIKVKGTIALFHQLMKRLSKTTKRAVLPLLSAAGLPSTLRRGCGEGGGGGGPRCSGRCAWRPHSLGARQRRASPKRQRLLPGHPS
mmetsp:Transcript_24739/g.74331  ORF Transcript_24739/g.74331 Transcript_24739/m.74331 type:complete len:233 (+) Transcript_24739:339-1037(+)